MYLICQGSVRSSRLGNAEEFCCWEPAVKHDCLSGSYGVLGVLTPEWYGPSIRILHHIATADPKWLVPLSKGISAYIESSGQGSSRCIADSATRLRG